MMGLRLSKFRRTWQIANVCKVSKCPIYAYKGNYLKFNGLYLLMDSTFRNGTWTYLLGGAQTVAGLPLDRLASLPNPPSTPLPSSPTQSTTPAWCPSSRTPLWSICPPTPLGTDDPAPPSVVTNAPKPAAANSDRWLWQLLNPTAKGQLEGIKGKLPLVVIIGTQPSSGNLGFRNGSLEGKGGIFVKFRNSEEATTRFISTDRTNPFEPFEVDIPTKYLQPKRPDSHSRCQRVLVLEGKLYRKPFAIMGLVEPGVWKLTALRGRNNGKDLHHIKTEHLVQYL